MGGDVDGLQLVAPQQHGEAVAVGELAKNLRVAGVIVPGQVEGLLVERRGDHGGDLLGQGRVNGRLHIEEGTLAACGTDLAHRNVLQGDGVGVHHVEAAVCRLPLRGRQCGW